MSSPESLVRDLLLRDPVISGQVGGSRIYPLIRPQGAALPAITYQRVSTVRIDPLLGRERVANVRLQIDCWTAKYADVKTLAQDVSEVLNAYALSPADAAGPGLRQILAKDGERDFYEADPAVYRVSGDYSVWWEED